MTTTDEVLETYANACDCCEPGKWSQYTIDTKRCHNCGQAIPHSDISYCDRCNLL